MEILDSRGNPTVETTVWLDDGSVGVSSVPSGASTGKYEAVELRDGDPGRFQGMGVLKAVENVNQKLAPALIGKDASYQNEIDQLLINLDGTEDKKNLGANAILSVSQGVLEAAAVSYKMPVYAYIFSKYKMSDFQRPVPTSTFNLINGGKHGAGNLDFQEFHIIPTIRQSYSQSLQLGEEVYQALKKVLIHRRAIHSVGDEGGFAPNLFTNMDALEVLLEAINQTTYELGKNVFLGLDVAASFFYKNNQYVIKDRRRPFSPSDLVDYYKKLNDEYRLFSLEDPFFEDDWQSWQKITQVIGQNTIVVGDDLLCTSKNRTQEAIKKKACTAILVKPNQVGTISETVEVVKIAREAGWKIIVSHRSGETNDDFIADFAVGVGADYTKFGAPARGERIVKYNRLLKIEKELNAKKNKTGNADRS